MTKAIARMQIGIISAIAEARQQAELSQRELSAKLNQGPTFIQRIESGDRDITVAEFITIATVLKIDPCQLLRQALL